MKRRLRTIDDLGPGVEFGLRPPESFIHMKKHGFHVHVLSHVKLGRETHLRVTHAVRLAVYGEFIGNAFQMFVSSDRRYGPVFNWVY